MGSAFIRRKSPSGCTRSRSTPQDVGVDHRIPIAFIASWSILGGLCQAASWLAWVCKGEPPTVSLSVFVDLGLALSPIPGIVQGVPASAACGSVCVTSFCVVWCEFRLPTHPLSDLVCSAALAWYECIPRKSLSSLSVYRRFYIFLLM